MKVKLSPYFASSAFRMSSWASKIYIWDGNEPWVIKNLKLPPDAIKNVQYWSSSADNKVVIVIYSTSLLQFCQSGNQPQTTNKFFPSVPTRKQASLLEKTLRLLCYRQKKLSHHHHFGIRTFSEGILLDDRSEHNGLSFSDSFLHGLYLVLLRQLK